MDKNLEKRLEDLSDRCTRRGIVTATGFLTLAEQQALSFWSGHLAGACIHLDGGDSFCERKAAFFLPEYMDESAFDVSEYIRCVKVTAFFGNPSHRDYMGSALALGIRREWLGDFRVQDGCAYIFCLPSVEKVLIEELTQAGRVHLKTESIPLDRVPQPEYKTRSVTFTVKSPRLDAVLGGMFGLSRAAAAEKIRSGGAVLNDEPCLRLDAPVHEGDVISLRGRGKGVVASLGGRTKKDRLFIKTQLYQ